MACFMEALSLGYKYPIVRKHIVSSYTIVQEKLNKVKEVRSEIKKIHEKIITEMKPKDFDQYIKQNLDK